MKTIGIIGGTGFVGQHLARQLVERKYQVIVFTRSLAGRKPSPGISFAHWDARRNVCDLAAFGRLDAVVHLAGAGVADKRWTEARKREIVDSRIKSTNFLVHMLEAHAPRCTSLVAASAIGIYGPDNGKPFSETSPAYQDFLGDTCQKWEAASLKGSARIRTTILRTGIVLGTGSGAFAEFVKPMNFGIMPILAGGAQVISWIHIDDLAGMYIYALENNAISGIFNAVAPQPVTNREMMHAIAAAKGGIKIPAPVPAFLLKIMLGELSIEILKSATVSAEKAMAAGFNFQFPDIQGAVRNLLH